MKTKSNYKSKKSFGSKISYNKCRNVWDWIIQISLWIASLCLILYEFLVKKKGRTYKSSIFESVLLGFFLIVYITTLLITLLFQLHSNSFIIKKEKKLYLMSFNHFSKKVQN